MGTTPAEEMSSDRLPGNNIDPPKSEKVDNAPVATENSRFQLLRAKFLSKTQSSPPELSIEGHISTEIHPISAHAASDDNRRASK